MNILTTNGLTSAYLTSWAGPDARISAISIRLGIPNLPGDELVFNGEVVGVDDDGIDVSVLGTNSRGQHVTGSVHLKLKENRD